MHNKLWLVPILNITKVTIWVSMSFSLECKCVYIWDFDGYEMCGLSFHNARNNLKCTV